MQRNGDGPQVVSLTIPAEPRWLALSRLVLSGLAAPLRRADRAGIPGLLAYAAAEGLAELRQLAAPVTLGGAPLSRPHGAPARVVIPEMYGYKGVKWLERMELVAHQPTGYWEGLGYDQNAWVGHSNGYTSA